ncbi:MAG: redox-sensing transcriptional repressor Rex [Lentisphaerae bacterium]|nr:redox-sensing transcriptional repressor Rex [Lentisphaerota bacterium]
MSNSSKQRKKIPPPALKRLTKYYAFVQELLEQGVDYISSQQIADRHGLTSSTVRQDLLYLDFTSQSQRGYNTYEFKDALKCVFGADKTWKLAVIGAGNLGQALALHGEFARRGFNISGIFDSDPKKIGQFVGSTKIRSMDEVSVFVQEHGVDVAVIAVPAQAAQDVADLLVASGIKGILNLTLTHIVVPSGVAVVEARIVASLFELSHIIKSAELDGLE